MMSYFDAGYDNFHEETMVEDIQQEKVSAIDAKDILLRMYKALGRNVCTTSGENIDGTDADAPLITCGVCGY